MSIPRKITINCQKCKKKVETTVFESLNTDFSPTIIEDVISGDCFGAKCPHCGFVSHLEYDLLYHDMKHHSMVWVIHKNTPDYEKKVAEVRSANLIPYDVTRIVSDMNALREKAACLSSGKDDRIVELCKVTLVAQLNKDMPNFAFKNAFYTYATGKDIVYFYDTSGKEIYCELDDEVYSKISELFKKPLQNIGRTPFQLIDYEWALSFFNNISSKDETAEIVTAHSTQEEKPIVRDSCVAKQNEVSTVKRAMFCRKCGAKLLEDSLFCSYCGTKVVF